MFKEVQNHTYRISEIAKKLNVNRSTVLRWIEKGYLHSIKYPSGIHRISKEELTKFIGRLKTNGNDRRPFKILIIDDEKTILDLLQDMLKEIDIPLEVKADPDGLDALLVIGSFKPDIIIIDYNLTDVNGIQIISKIRANEDYKLIPIILISGFLNDVAIEDLGINAFLKKPFSIKDIERAVKDCLSIT